MKGKQRREEPMFACVRIEDLAPEEHLSTFTKNQYGRFAETRRDPIRRATPPSDGEFS